MAFAPPSVTTTRVHQHMKSPKENHVWKTLNTLETEERNAHARGMPEPYQHVRCLGLEGGLCFLPDTVDRQKKRKRSEDCASITRKKVVEEVNVAFTLSEKPQQEADSPEQNLQRNSRVFQKELNAKVIQKNYCQKRKLSTNPCRSQCTCFRVFQKTNDVFSFSWVGKTVI